MESDFFSFDFWCLSEIREFYFLQTSGYSQLICFKLHHQPWPFIFHSQLLQRPKTTTRRLPLINLSRDCINMLKVAFVCSWSDVTCTGRASFRLLNCKNTHIKSQINDSENKLIWHDVAAVRRPSVIGTVVMLSISENYMITDKQW